ncbi:hypothetical protein AB0C33_14025 [Nonomuraea sp. NPDC048881]|uniref:hypothetical protein n=1 Tax=Nonomuraea sp. NPDC048881 TaxID=3155030 RepID=UPI003410D14A
MHAISSDAYSADRVKRLADKGIIDLIVGFRWPYMKGPDTEPQARKIEKPERFAESAISRINP